MTQPMEVGAGEAMPWWVTEPAPAQGIKTVCRDRQWLVLIEGRRYRVRARSPIVSAQQLTVQVLLWRAEEYFHVDCFDLYDPAAREAFIAEAARTCHYPSAAIEYDLAWLTRELARYRDAFLAWLLAARARATLQ
jgi:hypothetical protein